MNKKLLIFAIFSVILLSAFLVRSFNLNAPPFEQHMSRQTQTMSTILDFARNGVDFLHPKVNWMGYPGYLVFELPVFQAIGAVIHTKIGPQIAYIRIFNILVGLLSGSFLYVLAKKWFGGKIAFYALFFFFAFPINIVYQRAILIDPLAVLLMVLSLWLLDNYFSLGRYSLLWLFLLLIVMAVGLPIKALYFLPTFLFALYYLISRKPSLKKQISLIAAFAVALIVLAAWLTHASTINSQYYFSSTAAVANHLGVSSLLKPNFYGQMLWRAMNIMLTPLGIGLYLISWLSLYVNKKNNVNQNILLLITSVPFVYLACFANINHPHSYYQLPLMPFLAISLAYGLNYLVEKLDQSTKIKTAIAVILLFCFAISSLHVMVVNRYFVQEKDPLEFSNKIKGLIEPQKYALFLGGNVPDNRLASLFDKGRKYKSRGCEYLYAMDSFGLTKAFDSYAPAVAYFKEVNPHFKGHLDYVVFYQFSGPKPARAVFPPLVEAGFKISYNKGDLLIFRKEQR